MKKAIDYDLSKIEKITAVGTDIDLFITPRYRNHYLSNEYEPFSISLLKNLIDENSTFVDIGAHYGYYCLAANKYHPNINIIAVEPVEENFKILEKNFELNHISNCTLVNNPASDKVEELDFNISEASDSSGIYQHPLSKTILHKKMQTVVGDDLLKNVPKIDLIKIDVEGHEIAVLNGLSKTIKAHPHAKIIIEFNPKCQLVAKHQPEELLSLLQDKFGFELFLIDDHHFKIFRLTDNPYPWSEFVDKLGYANLLCIPKEEAQYTVYFSHTSELGGAEKSLLELLESNQKSGFLSHVVFPNATGKFVDKTKSLSIPSDNTYFCWWAGIQTDVPDQYLADSAQNIETLLETIKKYNPHHIFSNTSVIPWGAYTAYRLKLPHMWHINEFIEKDHGLKIKTNFSQVAKTIEMLSNEIVFNSEATRKEFSQYFDTASGKTIYYNVKISAPKTIESCYQSKDSLKLILLGGVAPGKRQDQAIAAVGRLLNKGLNIELLILGNFDPQDQYYKDLSKSIENYPQIKIHPQVSNPQDYLNQADALLMCSKFEAFGRVTVEAMLLGKPVIGAKSGGTTEIISDEENGLLYDPNSTDSLCNQIDRLYQNRELIKEYGKKAKKYAEQKFTGDTYAASIQSLLKRIKGQKLVNNESFNLITQIFAIISASLKTKTDLANQLTGQVEEMEKQIKGMEKQMEEFQKDAAKRIDEIEEKLNQRTLEQNNLKKILIRQNTILSERNNSIQTQIYHHESLLNQIYNSKFFKLWQKFNSLKKKIA